MRFLSSLIYFLLSVTDVLFLAAVWFFSVITLEPPQVQDTEWLRRERVQVGPYHYELGKNWLRRSEEGLWEMYVEGDGFERGVIEGKLTRELAEQQEIAFVSQIRKMIPSEKMLNYLKFFIAFFNRNLDDHVPDEYKEEIYGESLFASPDFDFIAPPYYRMLNYHAAHDIGHALQDKNMLVGCTSFGVWNNRTRDGSMLIGRNFDFFVGEEFAVNKIVSFVRPAKGHALMMVTWAGMIGAVSGMNEKGLTVTINASKSTVPVAAATPISIVAREILQYAGNIREAEAIARKRKTFVSESIMIGSAADGRTVIIEKTPVSTVVYEPEKSGQIVCSNHFQSAHFLSDSINVKNMATSSSVYRKERLLELLDSHDSIAPADVAAILRDRSGVKGQQIGLGNEKALNQLIAHHAVIFQPGKLRMWVSTNPYQMGRFRCYDFSTAFDPASSSQQDSLCMIPEDPFVRTTEFRRFLSWRKMREALRFAAGSGLPYRLTEVQIRNFIASNPEYWETWLLAGDYYRDQDQPAIALQHYRMALTKEITTAQDRELVQSRISESGKKTDI